MLVFQHPPCDAHSASHHRRLKDLQHPDGDVAKIARLDHIAAFCQPLEDAAGARLDGPLAAVAL